MTYGLCNQTVTVYNARSEQYHKTVIRGAHFDFNRVWRETKTGNVAETKFLLVIPQGADGKTYVLPLSFAALEDKKNKFTLADGDKVILGEGPDITTKEQWSAFIPSKVDGLVQIKNADPKFLRGEIVHVEASG